MPREAESIRNTQKSLRQTKANVAWPRREIFERSAYAAAAGSGRRRVDLFLDGPDAKVRDAVQVVFAREKVRPEYEMAAPDVTESELAGDYRILTLDALVRMKLTSFRDIDRVHIADLRDAGLIDDAVRSQLPQTLRDRLDEVARDPDE